LQGAASFLWSRSRNAIQLRLRRLLMFNMNRFYHNDTTVSDSVQYQFVFNSLACLAVRSELEPHQNSTRSRIRVKIMRLPVFWANPDPVESEFFAGSQSINFDWILFWIQIRPHFECLKEKCHTIFDHRVFQRSEP
jgi:hypothetical protein